MTSNRTSTSGADGGDSAGPNRQPNQPKNSRFNQQKLRTCKPLLTPRWVISIFILVGSVFIPIGIISLVASNKIVEIVHQYETTCLPPQYSHDKDAKVAYIKDSTIPKNCTQTLNVSKHMKNPIYVYYLLDNFYQNHRRYVYSRSDTQLRHPEKGNETDGCDPEARTGNNLPIIPCGLIAWSLFNDTYNFSRGNTSLTVNKKDISWKTEREQKFGKHVFPQNFRNGTLIGGANLDPLIALSEQEDLMVWMRTAAFPTFRKLYGKIEEDLQENDTITVNLLNNYNTYTFNGKKKLVLSTTNFVGGKNNFIGKAYLSVGGLCFFLALVFFLMHIKKPRPVGDPAYFSWNRNHPDGRSS